jgi:adenosylcobinamide-phosphate synthase
MMKTAFIIFFAFLLDLFLGDPRYRLHPVRIIGCGIAFFEKILRRIGLNGRTGGVLLLLMIGFASLTGYLVAHLVLDHFHPLLGLGFDLFLCYSFLALKDLIRHVRPLIPALETDDLPQAREIIGMVVGRDVRYLDREGVSRAAVETMAENFVDGFLSPLFWYVIGAALGSFLGISPLRTALSFMLIFKVSSTLDSMVGYKNPEYLEFGWAGARFDDFMNFIPARLSLIILFFGAWISGLHPFDGLRGALRDRLKHDSPNSAHAEAFVAGAMLIRLGGPTGYPEGWKQKPWLGEGNPDPGPAHIRRTVLLLKCAAWTSIVIVIATFLIRGLL